MEEQIQTRTTNDEKVKRFEFINNQLMEKYFELVWFARNIDTGKQKKVKEISDKYPKDIEELVVDKKLMVHGFHLGILAYSRFLSQYIEDTLDEDSDGTIELNGKKYFEIDGRTAAFEDFPMLDT